MFVTPTIDSSRFLFLAEPLETGVATQRVPFRIDPQKRRRKAVSIRNLQKALQPWNRAVFLAGHRLDERQILFVGRPIHCILRTWQERDRTLSFFYRCILLAEHCMN